MFAHHGVVVAPADLRAAASADAHVIQQHAEGALGEETEGREKTENPSQIDLNTHTHSIQHHLSSTLNFRFNEDGC